MRATRALRATSLLLAALGACAGGPAGVYVNRQQGFDGAWFTEDGSVHVDATGNVVTLRYQGRTFVFSDLGPFRGFLLPEDVTLTSRTLDFHATPEKVELRSGDTRLERPMDELPTDRKIVYVAGGLLFD